MHSGIRAARMDQANRDIERACREIETLTGITRQPPPVPTKDPAVRHLFERESIAAFLTQVAAYLGGQRGDAAPGEVMVTLDADPAPPQEALAEMAGAGEPEVDADLAALLDEEPGDDPGPEPEPAPRSRRRRKGTSTSTSTTTEPDAAGLGEGAD